MLFPSPSWSRTFSTLLCLFFTPSLLQARIRLFCCCWSFFLFICSIVVIVRLIYAFSATCLSLLCDVLCDHRAIAWFSWSPMLYRVKFELQEHSFNHLLADLHKNMYVYYEHTLSTKHCFPLLLHCRSRVRPSSFSRLILLLLAVSFTTNCTQMLMTACSRGQFFHDTNSFWFSRNDRFVLLETRDQSENWYSSGKVCRFVSGLQSVIDTSVYDRLGMESIVYLS